MDHLRFNTCFRTVLTPKKSFGFSFTQIRTPCNPPFNQAIKMGKLKNW